MKMNLDQAIDCNWRSSDTNSDIGNDESITETIRSEFDLADEKHSDTSITEVIIKKQHGDNNKMAMVVEEGLLNAMHNLQIASAKKIHPFRNPKVPCEHDDKIEEIETSRIEDQLSESLGPEIKNMSSKAMNLLSTQSMKSTNQSSPSLLSKSKSQSNISVNHTPFKNVVKTIADTEDGIQLKDEKIKFFGIPVQMARTKRTQVAPFHFQDRIKTNQQSQKIDIKSASACTKKLVTTSKSAVDPIQNSIKINKESKISNTGTIVSRKVKQKLTEIAPLKSQNSLHNNIAVRKSVVNVSENKSKVNKENNMSNNNIMASDGIKPKLTAISPKLYTDQRAKDRQIFDAKKKQRAIEMEEMRLRVEQKKREKEKLEVIAMRKKSQTKAKPIPTFKIPQRIASKKPLTEP